MCLFLRRVNGVSVKTFMSRTPLHRRESNSNSFCTLPPPWVQHWYCLRKRIFGPVFDIFFTQIVFVIFENKSTHSSHKPLKSSLSRSISVRILISKSLSFVHLTRIISNFLFKFDKMSMKSCRACSSPAILLFVYTWAMMP